MMLCVVASLSIMSCSLDPENPNVGLQETVIRQADPLYALTVEMQRFHARDFMLNVVTITGTTSRELAIRRSFVNLVELEAGGAAFPPANQNILALHRSMFVNIRNANLIIRSAPGIPEIPEPTRNGVLALSYFYKAISLGYCVQYFEKSPLNDDLTERAQYVGRDTVLAEVIRNLDSALAFATRTPATLATGSQFLTQVLSNGFLSGVQLPQTIRAFRARYLLFAGRYQEAIVAARTADSLGGTGASGATGLTGIPPPALVYDATLGTNVFWANIFNANNSGGTATNFAARDSFGLPASLYNASDTLRRAFFLGTDLRTPPSPNNAPPPQFFNRNVLGYYGTNVGSVPMYMPTEMILIRAEAAARLGDLTTATAEINRVRTKTGLLFPLPISTAFSLNTGTSPTFPGGTQQELLTEIYKQRCIELFLTGMRMEDARRLGIEAPTPTGSISGTTRTRNYYPYPELERINNPNTPRDPQI
jgi:starch-binding outer membrane protein, SusD/RagB family